MSETDDIMCRRCGVNLAMSEATLVYMGYEMKTDVPRCPICGEIYIDEELARGRMIEVEQNLEDK